jgi:hypothetical protein
MIHESSRIDTDKKQSLCVIRVDSCRFVDNSILFSVLSVIFVVK